MAAHSSVVIQYSHSRARSLVLYARLIRTPWIVFVTAGEFEQEPSRVVGARGSECTELPATSANRYNDSLRHT